MGNTWQLRQPHRVLHSRYFDRKLRSKLLSPRLNLSNPRSGEPNLRAYKRIRRHKQSCLHRSR